MLDEQGIKEKVRNRFEQIPEEYKRLGLMLAMAIIFIYAIYLLLTAVTGVMAVDASEVLTETKIIEKRI